MTQGHHDGLSVTRVLTDRVVQKNHRPKIGSEKPRPESKYGDDLTISVM